MSSSKEILVYAHWAGIAHPLLMGVLTAIPARGKEVFSFEYSKEWLGTAPRHIIDPDMQLYAGRYFPRDDKPNFGVFLDSCPDRWGRVLMDRREAVLAKQDGRKPKSLLGSDYLLGVYDGHRMGGLRFKIAEGGKFLNDDIDMAAPPWTSLRELQHASTKFEEDDTDDVEYAKWINLLIAPGSSLGGARPKASVLDTNDHLWIAKFPSIKDTKDVGGWEMVVGILARNAGLNMADGDIGKFNNNYHTYLTKRFDRNNTGERIHFASAMTMLGHTDGAGSDTGVSYLELAEFLARYGTNVNADLEELWRRIVFSICIKNTDDHLRNHGFLLTNMGWKLSPAYDINPNEHGSGLALNISESDNSLDIGLALSVIEYFRLDKTSAMKIVEMVRRSTSRWRIIAKEKGLSKSEQDRMAQAFE
ncbi:MAG: HipA domain-containing protein [Bacteroidota bacterium]